MWLKAGRTEVFVQEKELWLENHADNNYDPLWRRKRRTQTVVKSIKGWVDSSNWWNRKQKVHLQKKLYKLTNKCSRNWPKFHFKGFLGWPLVALLKRPSWTTVSGRLSDMFYNGLLSIVPLLLLLLYDFSQICVCAFFFYWSRPSSADLPFSVSNQGRHIYTESRQSRDSLRQCGGGVCFSKPPINF